MPTQDEYIQTLSSWDGWSGRHPDAAIRTIHAQTILPNDSLAWALGYLEDKGNPRPTSTCGVVGEEALRIRGCSHPLLSTPYKQRVTHAISDLVAMSTSWGAWTQNPARLAEYPEVGDILVLTGPEHVINIVGTEAATGEVLGIAGGGCSPPDENGHGGGLDCNTYIRENRGVLIVVGSVSWWTHPEKPYLDNGSPNGRMIYGRVLSSKLRPFDGLSRPQTIG